MTLAESLRSGRRDFLRGMALGLASALVAPPISRARSLAVEGFPVRLVEVAGRQGRFLGWPANNGSWQWDEGRELLVGFEEGPWVDQPGHKIGQPQTKRLARSLDGGRSWRVETPEPFVDREATPRYVAGRIRFDHPDFALRVAVGGSGDPRDRVGRFFVSDDRGRRWSGPYRFPGLEDHPQLRGLVMTSRTDYLVTGQGSALILMSAVNPQLGELSGRLDKPFAVRTEDGGLSFEFVNWIVPWSDPHRAVMPSTLQLASGDIVTALRRRNPRSLAEPNWIDLYASGDGGSSWSFRSRVTETGIGNGNPPALASLPDGRVACAYGHRDLRQMCLRLSGDGGRHWSRQMVIRSIPFERDLGYPRMAVNPRGELVLSYYLATRRQPHSHIEAALIDPAPMTMFRVI